MAQRNKCKLCVSAYKLFVFYLDIINVKYNNIFDFVSSLTVTVVDQYGVQPFKGLMHRLYTSTLMMHKMEASIDLM